MMRTLACGILICLSTIALVLAQQADTYPPDDVAEILVLGPDGSPMEGAKVELIAEPAVPDEFDLPEVTVNGTTGKDGRVRVAVEPFARYLLCVGKAPYATAGDVPCWGGNLTTFRLAMPGRIEGVVRAAETGEPLPGAKIRAFDWSFYGLVRTWTLTADEAGKYVIDDAAPGFVNVRARTPGRCLNDAKPAPRVESGSTVRADILLTAGKTVLVTVVDGRTGETLPQATVKTDSQSVTGPGSGIVSPPVLGSPSLDRGGWWLTVSAPGFLDARIPANPRDAFNPPPENISVKLTPPIPVSGTVRGEDGEPVSGLRINLLCMDLREVDKRWPVSARKEVTTAGDGTFSAPVGVPGGSLEWQLFVGGTWCAGLPVQVPEDAASVELATISLAEGARVRGRVLGPDSNPLSMVGVRAVRPGVRGIHPLAIVLTDSRGRFLLPWVLKGKVELSTGKTGFTSTRELDLTRDTVLDLDTE
jgi:hypothetical protein